MKRPLVVDCAWLAERLHSAELRLFDASFYLPAEARDAQVEFAAAHIPGARFFDIDAFVDDTSSLPHMVPGDARAEQLLGALGIANDHLVVFYDQKGLYTAARGWWTLRLFGHDRVVVLDGGLPEWRRQGRPVESGVPARGVCVHYRANFRSGLLRGLEEVRDNIASQRELVLDARPAARFFARAPEPRAGIRGGHIPGSINVPASELLNADGTLKSPVQLRALLAAAGVTPDGSIVTSCGSGVMASLLALSVEVAGFGPAAVYDGSRTEWGGRADTPIAITDD